MLELREWSAPTSGPSGGIYAHRGREQLRAFMSTTVGGGIRLEHCTVTDDGVVAAIEFTGP
jgi:hypothetical protein